MPSSYRVLIIDDEHNMRFTLCAVLQELGYEVRTAATAQDAQNILSQEHCVAVILDLQLPDMRGMDLLHWIRREHPFTAIIILTAYGTVDDAVEALQHGAAHFLQKPVSPDEINEALQAALDCPLPYPQHLAYQELIQIAERCLEAEAWRAADLALRYAILRDPLQAEAFKLWGIWHKRQGNAEEASQLTHLAAMLDMQQQAALLAVAPRLNDSEALL